MGFQIRKTEDFSNLTKVPEIPKNPENPENPENLENPENPEKSGKFKTSSQNRKFSTYLCKAGQRRQKYWLRTTVIHKASRIPRIRTVTENGCHLRFGRTARGPFLSAARGRYLAVFMIDGGRGGHSGRALLFNDISGLLDPGVEGCGGHEGPQGGAGAV